MITGLKAARRQARRYGEQIKALTALGDDDNVSRIRNAYRSFVRQFYDGTDDVQVIIEYLDGEYRNGYVAGLPGLSRRPHWKEIDREAALPIYTVPPRL